MTGRMTDAAPFAPARPERHAASGGASLPFAFAPTAPREGP
mgnify:CR=1 FL=1